MKKTRAFKRSAAAAMTALMVGGVMCVGAVSTSALDENSEPELYLGSVDGDSTITLVDAIMAQKYVLSMISFTDEQKLCADVNEDGEVNHLDSLCIQKYSDGIPTTVEKIGAKWFEAEYKYIEHPAKTEEEWVEATTENVPRYIEDNRTICNGCGLDITYIGLGHIHTCGPNYHDENVWLKYNGGAVDWSKTGSDDWVVKNKDLGNRTLVEMEDDLGKYYASVGLLGADKAISEAAIFVNDLEYEGGYESHYFGRYVDLNYCRVCGMLGFDDINEHDAEHIANSEIPDSVTGEWCVIFEKVEVPGHYETRVTEEAWTEKVLVKDKGWYY